MLHSGQFLLYPSSDSVLNGVPVHPTDPPSHGLPWSRGPHHFAPPLVVPDLGA